MSRFPVTGSVVQHTILDPVTVGETQNTVVPFVAVGLRDLSDERAGREVVIDEHLISGEAVQKRIVLALHRGQRVVLRLLEHEQRRVIVDPPVVR